MTPSVHPGFTLPSWFMGPRELHELLRTYWEKRYADLFEAEGEASWRDAVEGILEAFGGPDDLPGHRKYVYMAWSLALAAYPTVKAWAPDDGRPDQVLDRVKAWTREAETLHGEDQESLFLPSIRPPQALSEAFDVFRNLLLVLDAAQARSALMEILDDCLEGYAIFPGSEGRRALFDWWLTEVVPASWCLRLPTRIYDPRQPDASPVKQVQTLCAGSGAFAGLAPAGRLLGLPGGQVLGAQAEGARLVMEELGVVIAHAAAGRAGGVVPLGEPGQ
jgi:hypothetical protein